MILVMRIILDLRNDLLESFENSVKSRNFSQLTKRVHIWRVGDEVLDRQYWDEIYKEPASQISASYLLPIINDLFYFVVVGREEGEDKVHEEDYIDQRLSDKPLKWLRLIKRNIVRSDQAGEHNCSNINSTLQ